MRTLILIAAWAAGIGVIAGVLLTRFAMATSGELIVPATGESRAVSTISPVAAHVSITREDVKEKEAVMPSQKDVALMDLAETLIRSGDPDRAERAVRSIKDKDFREHGLMCMARDIATVSLRVDNRRYAKRLMRTARRIAQSIDSPQVREEAMAYVEATDEI
ncbi:hypothetical protein [Amycolatopsis sp. NPDC057786]|uniref:hypothetical protein n=1 Tax=Amycolatopsis sp. NPDC057786 TaxID=3346250 RepID=UPI00367306F7